MKLDRRSFMTSGIAAAAVMASSRAAAAEQGDWSSIKAVAFDAFTLFDPRPIFLKCETVAPGRGADLANLWRTRQFEYQWLRALAGQYQDYIVNALQDYKSGKRKNPIMAGIIATIDPKDFAAIAQFFSRQVGLCSTDQIRTQGKCQRTE